MDTTASATAKGNESAVFHEDGCDSAVCVCVCVSVCADDASKEKEKKKKAHKTITLPITVAHATSVTAQQLQAMIDLEVC
jgi:hypothetical protein